MKLRITKNIIEPRFPNEYIKESQPEWHYPVLDSIMFCITGTNNRVLYLGDRAKADGYFEKYFPNTKHRKLKESQFGLYSQYPNVIGVIDIDKGYRLKMYL